MNRPFPRAAAAPIHAIQGTLALDLRGGRPGLPETPELQPPGPARLPHVADTEVRAWAARLAQAVVEAVGGQRPVSQLVRWTAPDVYRDLERRVQLVRLAPVGASPGPQRARLPAHHDHRRGQRARAARGSLTSVGHAHGAPRRAVAVHGAGVRLTGSGRPSLS
jgi:hypothetical protein